MRIALIAILAVAVAASGLPFSPVTAQERARCQSQEVVMYSASWCAVCRDARAYMRSRGVDFFEIDIDATDNADVRRIARLGIPQIATERGWIHGFNVHLLRQYLCIY